MSDRFNMWLVKSLLLLHVSICVANYATLKKISDHEYAITGRGCGILNEIKYLDFIPEPITEENQCSIIRLRQKDDLQSDPQKTRVEVEKSPHKVQGTE